MSTNQRCIHCSRTEETEFHEIFDELGQELQLDILVERYFNLTIVHNSSEQPVLCDECVNRLIELFDVAEKLKEQGCRDLFAEEEEDQKFLFADEDEPELSNLANSTETQVDEPLGLCEDETATVNAKDEKVAILIESRTTSPSIVLSWPSGESVTEPECNEVSALPKIKTAALFEKHVASSIAIEKAAASTKTTTDTTASETNGVIEILQLEPLEWDEEFQILNDMETAEYLREDSADEDIKENKLLTEPNYCANEFDEFSLEWYLDNTINSNLEELQLQRDSFCRICSEKFTHHKELLKHIVERHKDKDSHFSCVLDDCCKLFDSERLLARHIVLHHYDLSEISIFGACPDCDVTYSNFKDFNKHSCCKSLKWRGGRPNFCNGCNMEFPSFKRFRFHMQFHMSKRRPKVCLLCDMIFTEGEEFFEHVHYAHEPDNDLICTKCDRRYKNKKSFAAHLATHNLTLKYQCTLCSRAYAYKGMLQIHMRTHQPPECKICHKTIFKKEYFRYHMKSHESETVLEIHFCTSCGQIGYKEDLEAHVAFCDSKCFQAYIEQDIVEFVYECEYCGVVFKTKDDLKNHRSTGLHLDKVFHCSLCLSTFCELRKMRLHYKTHQNITEWRKLHQLHIMFMCDIGDCDQAYLMSNAMYNHKFRKHKELRLICVGCNKHFDEKAEFDAHCDKCQEEEKYECQFCGKNYPTKMSRSIHITRSHNNKNISCSICKASLRDKKALEKHMEFVHVAVECTTCHKKFKNKRNLLLHKRVKHENVKRFFCDMCEKGFYNKHDLEMHDKTAHAPTSFVCEKCPFTTNYKNSLDIHMAMHNNDLQFTCHICNRQFARKRVMDLHVKRHDVQREFLCSDYCEDGCKSSFVTRHLLNKHLRGKHLEIKKSYKAPQIKRRRKQQAVNVLLMENEIDADDPDYVKPNEENDDYLTHTFFDEENQKMEFLIEESSS